MKKQKRYGVAFENREGKREFLGRNYKRKTAAMLARGARASGHKKVNIFPM